MEERFVKNRRIVIGALVAIIFTLSVVIYAQVSRPYRNGTVWNLAFIRMKPGMDTMYMNYIANEWKRNQEAMKKDGIILSYKVLTTEAHSNTDWNIMLMTEYKDLATMEANEEKADALAQRVIGDDAKQIQGYKDRLEYREVMADRLAREMVLEPRR